MSGQVRTAITETNFIATLLSAMPSVATSIALATPSETSITTAAFAAIVTSMDAESRLKVYTIDEQPSECLSRWFYYSTLDNVPIITSGNYADMVNGTTVFPGYWRNCYPDAPTNPAYSPAMCTGRWTLFPLDQDMRGYEAYRNGTWITYPPNPYWSARCCPTGMVYMNRCQSIISTNMNAEITPPTQLLPVHSGVGYGVTAGLAWAEPITVHWQFNDLSRFPSAYSTSLAKMMGMWTEPQTASNTNQASELANTDGSSKQRGRGVSEDALVGIILVAVVGAALLAGAAFFCLRRRRRRQRQGFSEQHGAATELPNHSTGFRSLIKGRWRAEIEAKPAPVEIDSGRVYTSAGPIAELEAPVHHPDKDPDQFSFTESNFETRRADTNDENRAKEGETTNEAKTTNVEKTTNQGKIPDTGQSDKNEPA